MVKRLCSCAFAIGLLLLLLAVMLVLQNDYATNRASASQAVRVAQAVTHLENAGCLTCHSTLVDDPASLQLTVAARTDVPSWAFASQSETILITAWQTDFQNQIDNHLAELGQRILALSMHEDAHAAAVTTDFLEVYAASRASEAFDESSAQVILLRIDGLTQRLQVAENQAGPFQWDEQTTDQPKPTITALTVVPSTPSPAVLSEDIQPDVVILAHGALFQAHQFVMPYELVYATHRRGPPAGAYLDSVWYGRLRSV